MTELTSKTIAELRDGIRGGEFSAREVAESYNAAVAAAKSLNAFTVETPDDALAAADAADKSRGDGDLPPLAGAGEERVFPRALDSTVRRGARCDELRQRVERGDHLERALETLVLPLGERAPDQRLEPGGQSLARAGHRLRRLRQDREEYGLLTRTAERSLAAEHLMEHDA